MKFVFSSALLWGALLLTGSAVALALPGAGGVGGSSAGLPAQVVAASQGQGAASSDATPGAGLIAISGIARNGTHDDRPLAGAVVELVQPGDGGANTSIARTRTDGAGRFAFPPRAYADDQLLMVSIDHGGFNYWTVAYDGGNRLEQVGIKVNSSALELKVFDTTTETVPLRFQVHHLAIEESEGGLKCTERIVVENLSRKTLLGVGPREISVLLNLPEGATNVQLDPKITDAKLVETTSGWGFVRPLTPEDYGVRNAIIVTYEMPWKTGMPWDKRANLSRAVAYPTSFFFVARTPKDRALSVRAPQLGVDEDQPVPIDGKTETRIVNSIGMPSMPQLTGLNVAPPGPALEANKALNIEVVRPVSPLFWGFAGLSAALCLFLPVALMRPRRASSPASGTPVTGERSAGTGMPGGEPLAQGIVHSHSLASASLLTSSSEGPVSAATLTSEARELISRIAELDELREAGKIEDHSYREQRARWKNQLMSVVASTPPVSPGAIS